jgi:hypothetical protein
MAFIWFLYDLHMAYTYTNAMHTALFANGIIFIMNISIAYKYYIIVHSIWHLLSAYKCFYLSQLLGKNLRQM